MSIVIWDTGSESVVDLLEKLGEKYPIEIFKKIDDLAKALDDIEQPILILDHDHSARKVEKLFKKVSSTREDITAFYICNNLKKEKIIKYQKSKSGVHAYLKSPIDETFIAQLLSSFGMEPSADPFQKPAVSGDSKAPSFGTMATAPDPSEEVAEEIIEEVAVENETDNLSEEDKKIFIAVVNEYGLKEEFDPRSFEKHRSIQDSFDYAIGAGAEDMSDDIKLDDGLELGDDLTLGDDDSLSLGADDEDGLDLSLGGEEDDAGELDLGSDDAGELDLGSDDAGELDLGSDDAGELDLGSDDAGELDLGSDDAGELDLGSDDAGELDLGSDDAGELDLGSDDAGELDLGSDLAIEFVSEEEVIAESPEIETDTIEDGADDLNLDFSVTETETPEEIIAVDESEIENVDLEFGVEETTSLPTETPEEVSVEDKLSEIDAMMAADELSSAAIDTSATEDKTGDIEIPSGLTVVNEQVASRLGDATGEFDSLAAGLNEEPQFVEAPFNKPSSGEKTNTHVRNQMAEIAKMMGDADEDTQAETTGSTPKESHELTEVHVIEESLKKSNVSLKDQNEIVEYHSDELGRLAQVIQNLREDRESLMKKVEKLEYVNESEQRDTLTIKSELDEKKIELSLIKKRFNEQYEEAKYKVNIAEEKKRLIEEKNKNFQRELEGLNQRVKFDLKKIQSKESELESQLELLRVDAQTQIQNRDKKILELKRKIDTLEFDIENVMINEKKEKEDSFEAQEKMEMVMKTLRSAITLLEGEENDYKGFDYLKKNLDL